MAVDLRRFFQATNPSKTLVAGNPEDQKFYIDFSPVRGGKIIEELKDNITFFSPDEPTCVLFTGHIGCGKSTELLRLKAELEQEGFHVVYFESSEDLEMADVDIGDVLLAIAKRVSESLEQANLDPQATGFRALLAATRKVLLTEINVKAGVNLPVGKVELDTDKREVSLSAGIAELTVVAKNDQNLRDRLNQFLGPQKNKLLDAINQELLEPAIARLKQRGKKGLVVIVDNLDRIDSRAKSFGRPQQEYLFIDQSECLTRLRCHLVYTMPLALKFSNEYGMLTQRYEEPKVLPMVPLQFRDGQACGEGLALLQQMVLARAFPELKESQRLEQIPELFDSPASLERLCCISGGHVRDLLRLLNDWIKKGRQVPLSREMLEEVIRARRNEMMMPISDDEWELLRQVRQRKKVSGDQGYQTLIRSRLVFEYRDRGESWFDVNPILAEAEELQECQ
ncbi:ATP-binding protein [Leptothermofonsia sichuanensis E412]|uniref:ATP-binding protein n=1 Tax=Leptothermofonsia sichuanensis TaxID=2917832 RepID=UPI001CA672BB|nr:ATP-binding protein [Leptothermofonsia sichuanensis]QZZ22930.1 ATP-binding protein [Leptothermofonsia sichuanensis E412]